MQVDHYVTLHLTATQVEVIPAMQGDGARCLLASLMANGEPWTVPEGTNVGIAYTLPDKTADYYDRLTDGSPAATVAGNLVSAILAPVLTKQAGTAKLSLVLRQGERQIATFPLQLKVQAAVGKVLGEDVPVQPDGFEGRLYYGGPGGTIIPLALGPGLVVRDGVLYVVGASPEKPEKPVGAVTTEVVDGDLRIYLDGQEVAPVVDAAGDLTWPGLRLTVDADGNGTLTFEEV